DIGLPLQLRQTLPTIDLTGVPIADALRRLVALDSRYELVETRGTFLVRPKAGVPGRIDVLDQKVDGFSASNVPASSVIQRIAERIGTYRAPPTMSPSGQTSPIAQMLARPITFALTGDVTIRDVLSAIATGVGGNWSMRPSFRPGSPTLISIAWRVPNGSTSTSITLATDLS